MNNKRGSLLSTGLVILALIVVLTLIYLMLPFQNSFIILIILIILLAGIYTYLLFFSTAQQLKKKLNQISPLLPEENIDILKKDYLEVYQLYLKLSEHEKQSFYPKITQLREKIEEQLRASKKVEEMLQKSTIGSFKEQEQNYKELYQYFQTLSPQTKLKYYTSVTQLKERLERGK